MDEVDGDTGSDALAGLGPCEVLREEADGVRLQALDRRRTDDQPYCDCHQLTCASLPCLGARRRSVAIHRGQLGYTLWAAFRVD